MIYPQTLTHQATTIACLNPYIKVRGIDFHSLLVIIRRNSKNFSLYLVSKLSIISGIQLQPERGSVNAVVPYLRMDEGGRLGLKA